MAERGKKAHFIKTKANRLEVSRYNLQFQREFIIFEIGQREFSFAFSLLTLFHCFAHFFLDFFFASTE